MPTYEYKCDACGHAFEQFQSMSAEPVRRCPKCKKLKVKRLISTGAGLIFKGSGFYITDYRDQGYKDKAKADAPPSETKSDTADTSKSASTPDASKPATEAKASTPAAESSAKSSEKSEPKSESKSESKESGKKRK